MNWSEGQPAGATYPWSRWKPVEGPGSSQVHPLLQDKQTLVPLSRSYEQGLNQSVAHYLDVKKALFKRGWPNSAKRSTAFFILDTLQGLCIVRSNLDKEDILDFEHLTLEQSFWSRNNEGPKEMGQP
ncbi:MAG: hypothetical protein GY696_20465 [Gammaproteobacteria bacterium]|nr:hypothetical protein [Gammaproteobacteria bacterium]